MEYLGFVEELDRYSNRARHGKRLLEEEMDKVRKGTAVMKTSCRACRMQSTVRINNFDRAAVDSLGALSGGLGTGHYLLYYYIGKVI